MQFLEKSSSFYYIIIDLEGKYSYVNKLFGERFAFISKNLLGKPFAITIHPDDVEMCNQAAMSIIEDPSKVIPIKVRKPRVDKDADHYWTEWEFSAHLDNKGRMDGIQCVGYNITEVVLQRENLTKSMELLEEKNRELKKINSELDNFVYRVSHDLRSPITSLLGLNQLIRNTKKSGERQQYLDLQKRSLFKLDDFIKDILNYSRNSRVETTLEKIDLNEMVREVLEEIGVWNISNLKVEIGELPTVIQDKFRLRIILNNLLSNASKYINRGQQNRKITISAKFEKNLCQIWIKDNGIGIREQDQERVFDMFYRATDHSQGSGIGLYIVKEAVEKINGSLLLESRYGKGSIFEVTFKSGEA